jgi:hypothetical protein
MEQQVNIYQRAALARWPVLFRLHVFAKENVAKR